MRRDERGLSNGVQAALLFPLAFGVLLAVLQWALLVWAESTALAAAQDGARAAATVGGTRELGRATAQSAAQGAALSHVAVASRRTSTRAQVVVTGRPVTVIPGITPTVSRTAEATVERITRG